jgi:hypothetical protein
LVIKRVEVVVLGDPVFGRLSIKSGKRARENRQLFARIVADYANLSSYLRALRIQRQFGGLDELQLRRIVTIQTEVVDRIAVDGI